MSIRKIRFWVRVLPRSAARRKTQVLEGVYSSGKKANAAKSKRAGQIAVSVEGFYHADDGLVLSKQGKWVKRK